MSAKSLTVAVPESLFKQIRTRAKQAKRTVEAEVVTLLSEAVSDVDRLPPDIVEVLANVEHLDDAALRDAIIPILTKKQAKRLAALNYKAQDDGLTDAEELERDELLQVADKSMILSAAVLAELRKRGVDVSKLIAP